MIVFYDKETGRIRGTIEGRTHGEAHLKQWVGNRELTERLVVNWKQLSDNVHEPDIEDPEQKEIFVALDKNPLSVYTFKVEVDTKRLVRKGN